MNAKKRTVLSFSILLVATVSVVLAFEKVQTGPRIDEAPAPLRQVLEWNGRVWAKLQRPSARNETGELIRGRNPRVNGDLGIDEDLDLSKWTMTVIADDHDESSRHLTLNMDAIRALPRTDTNPNFHCIEGWSEKMSFAGVKFSDFMQALNLTPKRYVGLETPDGEYYVSIDTESMMHEQTLLAYEMNGAPLRRENGAPLRLVIPVKYGIKSLKQIGKIFFSDTRPRDYWAERGYDWFSGL